MSDAGGSTPMRTLAVIAFSFVPTVVLSCVGILVLVFQRAAFDIVFGILIIIPAVAVLTGGIMLQRLFSRQARTARLQTDFVAKVSHELRTPLANIRMFVDTLREGRARDESEAGACLDVIATETSRLSAMIERLLDWGRMQAGRRTYTMAAESAAALVGEALARFEPQLNTSGLRLEVDLPDPDPQVRVDREAMVETFLNLLNNALKYGASGGVIAFRVRAERRRVTFEVEDRGPGIPASEHRRIFERFYRGSEERFPHAPGTGLGLALARLVVRAHRGRIRVHSRPGAGARFVVEIPGLEPPRPQDPGGIEEER